MIAQLEPLDWVVAGAAAVSVYVLASMWLGHRASAVITPPAAEE